jgi:hypothetical protein
VPFSGQIALDVIRQLHHIHRKRGKHVLEYFLHVGKKAVKVPNSTEQMLLLKAGFGVKRIQLCLDDKTETVVASLKNKFPKTRNGWKNRTPQMCS